MSAFSRREPFLRIENGMLPNIDEVALAGAAPFHLAPLLTDLKLIWSKQSRHPISLDAQWHIRRERPGASLLPPSFVAGPEEGFLLAAFKTTPTGPQDAVPGSRWADRIPQPGSPLRARLSMKRNHI